MYKMGKPVLVLVMASTCGACQNFKRNSLDLLEKQLANNEKVEFLKYEFPDMLIPPNDSNMKFEFHPQLRLFARWFPTFILFPDTLWFNKGSNLEGIIKNEEEVTNRKMPDYNIPSIMSWIDETIKEPIFNKDTRKILLTENGNSLMKQSKDGKMILPTYGTYTKFINQTEEEEF